MDRVLGSDPGLTRLLMALESVAAIAAAILVEWLFVRLTHALQIDSHHAVLLPAQSAATAARNHSVLVVAMMVGAIMGIAATFTAAMFVTPRAQLENFILIPTSMIAGVALGLALAPYRVVALTSFVVVIAAGAYGRRFGARGFVAGLLLFLGDFMGYFFHGAFHLADLGWLSAEILIGVLVAGIAHFTLFYPSRRAALRRTQRSYAVRARELATTARDLFDNPGDRQRVSRRLHRRLTRLNETALMIDAQLGDPGAVPDGESATTLHQELFDSELALTNMCRFAERLADLQLPADIRELISQALAAVGELDVLRAEHTSQQLFAALGGPHPRQDLDQDSRIVVHRLAVSVLGFAEAKQRRQTERGGAISTAVPDRAAQAFAPALPLVAGWLPGSAIVSAAASFESGQPTPHHRTWRRPRDRRNLTAHVGLAPYTRVAIQLAVATTVALLLGDLVSGRRFYWAVLAVFVTFMGSNNVGEQLRRGFFRIGGTVVGVLLGVIGAHLVGNRTGIAIAVILVSLFLGLYFMRISYAFTVIGVTITMAQLYVQLDEFTNALLIVRLEETALGAAVAALTVLCVFPLRTRRVARLAARQYLHALADIISQGISRLAHPGTEVGLQAAARRLDGSYQTLMTTMQPIRPIPFIATADSVPERFLQAAAASRHYARNLLTDATVDIELTPPAREQLIAAGQQQADSISELIAHLNDHHPTPRTYTRAAALFDQVASLLDDSDYLAPPQLALRDLQLLDGSMATVAQAFGLTVHALDTDTPKNLTRQ